MANRPDPRATRLAVDVPLGEAGAAWQWTRRDPGQPARNVLEVRWRRGPFAFEVQTIAASEKGDLAEVIATAEWADAHVAAVPFPDLTPTVVPPGSEAERLVAMQQLQTLAVRGLRASELPAGFQPFAVGVYHPADNLVNTVVFTPGADAQQLLEQSTETTRRLAFAGWGLGRGLGPGGPVPPEQLFLVVSVDADAAAAGRDLADPLQSAYTLSRLSGLGAPGTAPAPPPVSLGDETMFWVIPLPPRQEGGPGGERLALRWRHGRVVLSIESVAPVGGVTVEELIQAAQALEAAYQASELATLDGPETAAGEVNGG